MYPDFPYELIQIADTRKPFLPEEQYHFSISHCGDFAAAIVSRDKRVGIDIEIPVEKIARIQDKFLSGEEKKVFNVSMFNAQFPIPNPQLPTPNSRLQTPVPIAIGTRLPTLLWSAKESVFKWYGEGGVDFRLNTQLREMNQNGETIGCYFSKTDQQLT